MNNEKLKRFNMSDLRKRGRGGGSRNLSLIKMSIIRTKNIQRVYISIHESMLEKTKLKSGDSMDLSINGKEATLFPSENGNTMKEQSGRGTRLSLQFSIPDELSPFKAGNAVACGRVECEDGLIAFVIPDKFFPIDEEE